MLSFIKYLWINDTLHFLYDSNIALVFPHILCSRTGWLLSYYDGFVGYDSHSYELINY